jgi:uncharacterized coiled-coil protein SlyX
MTLEERCQEAFDKRVAGTAMLPASDLLSLLTKIEKLEAVAFQAQNAAIDLAKQLAEREATIQKMREGLKVATSICWSNFSEAQEVVLDEALSLPSPTEHLSQYRDAVIEECAGMDGGECIFSRGLRDMAEEVKL